MGYAEAGPGLVGRLPRLGPSSPQTPLVTVLLTLAGIDLALALLFGSPGFASWVNGLSTATSPSPAWSFLQQLTFPAWLDPLQPSGWQTRAGEACRIAGFVAVHCWLVLRFVRACAAPQFWSSAVLGTWLLAPLAGPVAAVAGFVPSAGGPMRTAAERGLLRYEAVRLMVESTFYGAVAGVLGGIVIALVALVHLTRSATAPGDTEGSSADSSDGSPEDRSAADSSSPAARRLRRATVVAGVGAAAALVAGLGSPLYQRFAAAADLSTAGGVLAATAGEVRWWVGPETVQALAAPVSPAVERLAAFVFCAVLACALIVLVKALGPGLRPFAPFAMGWGATAFAGGIAAMYRGVGEAFLYLWSVRGVVSDPRGTVVDLVVDAVRNGIAHGLLCGWIIGAAIVAAQRYARTAADASTSDARA
ncbi:MAG: hypothetical protein ACRDPK_14235 [Carbonactinosporaceae bacterium]